MKNYKNLVAVAVTLTMLLLLGGYSYYVHGGSYRQIFEGDTNQSVRVHAYVPADQTNPGNPVNSLTAGNTQVYYQRDLGSVVNAAVTVNVIGNVGTHTDNKITPLGLGGFWVINLPDAAWAAGANVVTVWLENDKNEADFTAATVELRPYDINDSGMGFSLDVPLHQAQFQMVPDDGAGTDQYLVSWLTNGAVEESATAVKIAIVSAANTNLVGSIASAQAVDGEVGTSNVFEYTESTNRMANDTAYLWYAEATIGGSTRTDVGLIHRDAWTNTLSELAQGAPSATPTPSAALMALYMALRNEVTVDSSAGEKTFSNDAGTVIFKKGYSDSGTVYTETEAETGP